MIAGWYPSAERNVVAEVGERNLKIRRDWGFAPEYVEGMRLILCQISVRAERGEAVVRVALIATIYWAPGGRMRSGSCELGWIPQQGLEVFLADMLTDAVRPQQST